MIIKAIICGKCGDTIYSRTVYDFHNCSCGNCFIDGGFDHFRYGSTTLANATPIILDLDLTIPELYDDWNKHQNKYGLIKGPSC